MKIMINILLIASSLYLQSDTAIEHKHAKPNQLIHASSPYLLQHAYNPVDWYEWGSESLEKAKKENKPLLISIGYASCHWCHVMAHESFENEEIAAVMNKYFINIKVDREERPDIDQVYMDAIHAMGKNGGWPLNVFATPDQKPFFGGTYFPPKQWLRVVTQIANAYREEYTKVSHSAEALAKHIARSELASIPQGRAKATDGKDVHAMYTALAKKFDPTWGGMAGAPKFVMPTQWLFLLRYYHKNNDDRALKMVTHTLNRIAMGGLYDQVGGGFSRYSVDGKWFAPHFEKMLYDNAQLLQLYSEAYTVTHDPLYKRIVYETVAWLEREMTGSDGGFYSSINADSEGEEGKFYVWKKDEFDSLLHDRPAWISDYYSVSQKGNWEHGNNILFIRDGEDAFMKKHHLEQKPFDATIKATKAILQQQREKRIKPDLDDKILTGWNAMMIHGLLHAYRAFGDPHFLTLAENNMRFIEKHLIADKVYRSFKGKRSDISGFLEDYSWLIQAYISLYQVTFDESLIDKAAHWATYVQRHFFDEEEGFYTFSEKSATRLIANKKELFDNVIPASNSVMANNVYLLGTMLDKESYKQQALEMVKRLQAVIRSEPSYMSNWGMLYEALSYGTAAVVIVGKGYKKPLRALQKNYTPFSVFMGTASTGSLPLVKDKVNPPKGKTTVYVCYDKVCKRPVHTAEEALKQLNIATTP